LENYRLLQERQTEIGGALYCQWTLAFLSSLVALVAFSALTLLVGRQEGHPACKKWGIMEVDTG